MKKPIKILHVLGRLDRGGAETMIMNLYRNIDRNEIQFDFVIHTNDKCDFNDEIYELGGKIHSIPRYNGKNHFAYKRAWNLLLAENPEYKIIHGHIRSTASIYLKIAKNYGLITIAHSHSIASRGNWLQKSIKNILQVPIRFIADYMFACSTEAGKWLFGGNIQSNNNFFIIKNAIDIQKFNFNQYTRTQIRKKYKLTDKYVLGHVGNFTFPKNHKFLLDRLVDVLKVNPNIVLLLIGDGDTKQQFLEEAKVLGVENEILVISGADNVNEYLQAMDVFIFPSIFEGLGIAAIEAQAAGLPCIISNQVPKDVAVTDLVVRLPLQSVDSWNSEILKFRKLIRENQYNPLQKHGYDIKKQSVKLQEMYFEMIYNH